MSSHYDFRLFAFAILFMSVAYGYAQGEETAASPGDSSPASTAPCIRKNRSTSMGFSMRRHGALIQAENPPSEGSDVEVRFTFQAQGIHLQGTGSSEVVHAQKESEEQTFGVQFETSVEKFWAQLTPVIQALLEETGEHEQGSD